MTVDHPVDEILPAWGRWARLENRSGLGYAQVQYSEMIARSTSATDWNPRLDPEIVRLDEIIRTRLANPAKFIIISRYRDGLTDKIVATKFGVSRSQLNRMLHLVVLPQLRHEWDLSKV
jgi:DNA-directed RNA polymerase specialized sigma subunit